MKIIRIIAVLLLIVSVQAQAQEKAEMLSLPNGLKYQIFTANAGAKIKVNDIITFNFIQKTDKDSVLANSFTSNSPQILQVQPSRHVADLMAFFPLLALNDSAIVSIPTDSIFTSPQMERPPSMPPGSSVFVTVKINKIQSMEEAMAEQKKVMDEMKNNEASNLAKYLTEKKINALKTTSGLRYIVIKSSVKPKPVKGDTVFVNYVGKTLEGKVFDSSIEAEAKKAGLVQHGRKYEPINLVLGEGRVIPGWEEGLLLLNEGSKATFIIPSELAYGPQGMGEAIRPFSTLVFDLELVRVKHPKKATLKSAPAKTSTPKSVTKKPVAKPAAKPAAKASGAKTTTKKN